MSYVDIILNTAGQEFIDNIRKQLEDKSINNTKRASDSLSFIVKDNKLEIEGLLYTIVLVTGRKSGKFPPIDPIKKWVETKLGLTGKEADRAAFLIARKISLFGTDIFIGKAKGLELDLAISAVNDVLLKEIANKATVSITQTIADAYKQ